MKKLLVLFTVISLVVFQSCSLGTSVIVNNENIDQSVRDEISILDKKVIDAAIHSDSVLLRSLMSDTILNGSGKNISSLMPTLKQIVVSNKYEILKQLLVKNLKSGMVNTIPPASDSQDGYFIRYRALNENIFVSILKLEKKNNQEFIISNVYGQYPEGWKLNIVQFGQYKIFGKSAPYFFREATIKYEKGHLLDAINDMYLCNKIIRPVSIWQFEKETEMLDFYRKISKEGNSKYNFPMTFESVNSKPKSVSIFPIVLNDGYYPEVTYESVIDLADTAATRIENELVHVETLKAFKGLEENNKAIVYKVYNKMSPNDTERPIYRFVKKLK
jgi:hypothetical protein